MMKGDVPQKLYRSREKCVIAGVSGGLGDYFNVDPIIFRILFVALVFVNGIGVFIYLLLWIIVPRQNESVDLDKLHIHTTIREKMNDMESHFGKEKNSLHKKSITRSILALTLVVVGMTVLISNLFSLYVIRFDIAWPAIITIIGLYLIFKNDD